jgi:hypothetical protein
MSMLSWWALNPSHLARIEEASLKLAKDFLVQEIKEILFKKS